MIMIDSIHKDVIIRIRNEEQKASLRYMHVIEESYQMTLFLKKLLSEIKKKVIQSGLKNESQEVQFFKKVKPEVLAKLIYYNKVYRIETLCPASSGKLYRKYFSKELNKIKLNHQDQLLKSDFYRYYRSGRTDRDVDYFRLGNIKVHQGLNSFAFELDDEFSTYYDYKVAQIIANDLLHDYLLAKTNEALDDSFIEGFNEKDVNWRWTGSKNELIELIYAVYISASISNGKVGVRKLTQLFQKLFHIELGDTHHAFHRMKNRTESRTLFLDKLKSQLEQYMEKE